MTGINEPPLGARRKLDQLLHRLTGPISRPPLRQPPVERIEEVVDHRETPPWRLIGLIASGVVALSAFLPWLVARAAVVGEVSFSGLEGDGKFALVLGVAGAATFWFEHRLSLVVGIVAVAWGVYEWQHISARASDLTEVAGNIAVVSMGYGVWLFLIASIVALVAAWQVRQEAKP